MGQGSESQKRSNFLIDTNRFDCHCGCWLCATDTIEKFPKKHTCYFLFLCVHSSFCNVWPCPCSNADINECLGNDHECNHVCINTMGSYLCSCNVGYELSANQKTCVGKQFVVPIHVLYSAFIALYVSGSRNVWGRYLH